MFPPTKPRKPDRLDDHPKGSLLHEETKAEFTRIRALVREITNQGGAIVLGVQKGERFDFRLPQDALLLGCEWKDLQGVLRRMCKSRELMYEQYEWTWEPLKGQIWKWYVKREDWDEKRNSGKRTRVHAGADSSGSERGDIPGEWDIGEGADDYADEFD